MDNIIKNDVLNIIKSVNFNKIKNKSILITGASGIIGTYMVETLYNLNEKIKFKVYLQHRNKLPKHLNKVLRKKNFRSLKFDLSKLSNLKKIPKTDFVVHLAGYGQPIKFTKKNLDTLTLNTTVTMYLLNNLNKKGSFLYASSSEIYNGAIKKSLKENTIGQVSPYTNRSSYIYSKLTGETIVGIYNENGINAKSARISMAYGPGTKKNDFRVINQIISKGINNKVIDLLDDGSALRPFCYISDTVEILWNILFKGKEKVYNVGNSKLTSILDLSKLVSKMLKVKVNIKKNKNALNAPLKVNININRIKKEFNKKKFITLNDGLKKTITWQKINLF